MDVFASVLDSRNLSHSSLILRNLYTTLQVGNGSYSSEQVEAERVPFRAGGPHETLAITLRNAQTQTVMFVRKVPLNIISGQEQAVTLWVAVYPPGDPRDLTFDSTPPRPDVPQVLLSLLSAGGPASSVPRGTWSSGGVHAAGGDEVSPVSSLGQRGSAPGSLSTGLPRGSGGADYRSSGGPASAGQAVGSVGSGGGETDSSARGSLASGAGRPSSHAALSSERMAALERAEVIKMRISASTDVQRKERSTTQQLQEVQKEVEELKAMIKEAEEELRLLVARRADAERHAQEAKEACARHRETLQLRDLSIAEIRNTRDEADEQLSQVMVEREQKRKELDGNNRTFGDQVRGLTVELEQRRAEAVTLSEALQRCDKRVLELREDATKVESPGGAGSPVVSAEFLALRRQLDEANRELEQVQASATEMASRAERTEEECKADKANLAAARAAAEQAREELRAQAEVDAQKSEDARRAAEEVEKELRAQASRAAQLDGQVSENQNQIKELESRLKEVLDQVEQHEKARGDSSLQLSRLKEELVESEVEGERLKQKSAALSQKLTSTKAETLRVNERKAVLEADQKEAEEACARKHVELDATCRVLDTVLESTGTEARRLEEARNRHGEEVTSVKAQAEAKQEQLVRAEAQAEAASQELQRILTEQASRREQRSQAEARLEALHPELAQAQERLRDLESESSEMESCSKAAASEHGQREIELEEKLRGLELDCARNEATSQDAAQAIASLTASLEEQKGLLPQRHSEEVALEAESSKLKQEQQAARDRLSETHAALAKQNENMARVREVLQRQKVDMEGTGGTAEEQRIREDKLRGELETTRREMDLRMSRGRVGIAEAEAARATASLELADLRAKRAKLLDEKAQLAEQAAKASERLAAARAEATTARAESAARLQAAEAAHAQHESQEADLQGQTKELEEKASTANSEASKLKSELAAQEASLRSEQEECASVGAEFARLAAELESQEESRSTAENDEREAQAQLEELRQRHSALLAELMPHEGIEKRLAEAKSEYEATVEKQQRSQEERERVLAAKDAELREAERNAEELSSRKNQELDHCIEKIDTLEREVMKLSSNVEGRGVEKGEMERKLEAAEADEEKVRAELSKQLLRAAELQEEQHSLEQRRTVLDARVAAGELRLKPSEEEVERQKARLEVLRSERQAAVEAAETATLAGRGRLEAAKAKADAEARRLDEATAIVSNLRAERFDIVAKQEIALSEAADGKRRVAAMREEMVQAEAASQDVAKRAAMLQAQDREAELEASAASEEQYKADERKVSLLKEQLADLAEAQAKARMESHFLEGVKEELNAELKQLREEMHSLADSLAIQVEHGNLQYSTVEKLEEDVRRAEAETEELTLALHEADLHGEVLQKEHDLLQQKLEGRYQGSLQDFATDVRSVWAAAEEEKHKDELAHWKQVAEDVEQEVLQMIESARQQLSQVEVPLQDRLNALIAECEQKARDFEARFPEVSGSVHSVPASLHGLVDPARPLVPAQATGGRKRALVIGCNYSRSHAPLTGCSNDAWNIQCLLRHSLRYAEDQVLSLIDCSEACPTPDSRQPTRANIVAGLKWLTKKAAAGDNLMLFFSGYGTQQPLLGTDGIHQGCLVPSDFAEDLPQGFFDAALEGNRSAVGAGRAYRLVPLAEVTAMLGKLPAQCKVTIVLDSCHSVVPQLSASPEAAPFSFPRASLDVEPGDVLETKGGAAAARPWRPRFLELPPLPMTPPPPTAGRGPPECLCHCYAACRPSQWCAELPIEGCVQGAFTWAFVKALTAGHLDTTVNKHMNSLRSILGNLRAHFRWVDQTPVLQLSGAAGMQDPLMA